MSSGLNPTGTLCLGAINTSMILIGNVIKIDNTTATAEITIDGETYSGTGTPTVFPNIISSAGLNPTGTLYIGTSNTSEVIMGPLKIDNTVVPSQIYVNEIALAPDSLIKNGDKFTLENSMPSSYNNNPNASPDFPIITLWNWLEATETVEIDIYSGSFRALSLVAPGIYDIRVNISITAIDWTTSPAKFYWIPRPGDVSNFTDVNNAPIPEGDELPGSSIDFTFNGNSNETFTGYKKFRVYTNSTNSRFIIATNTLLGRVNVNGTNITIRRIRDWPPTS